MRRIKKCICLYFESIYPTVKSAIDLFSIIDTFGDSNDLVLLGRQTMRDRAVTGELPWFVFSHRSLLSHSLRQLQLANWVTMSADAVHEVDRDCGYTLNIISMTGNYRTKTSLMLRTNLWRRDSAKDPYPEYRTSCSHVVYVMSAEEDMHAYKTALECLNAYYTGTSSSLYCSASTFVIALIRLREQLLLLNLPSTLHTTEHNGPNLLSKVKYFQNDRSTAIYAALQWWKDSAHVPGDPKFITCYAHIAGIKGGIFKRHHDKFATKEGLALCKSDITLTLRFARTYLQHSALCRLAVERWRGAGEGRFADYFEANLMMADASNRNDWRDSWFYSASGMPGVKPSANPIERSNLALRNCLPKKKCPLGYVWIVVEVYIQA